MNQLFVLGCLVDFVDAYETELEAIELVLSIAASAVTIVGGILFIVAFICIWWKKRRVNAFLKQCDMISDRIAEILTVVNDGQIDPEKTHDKIRGDVKEIIDDKKGVARLRDIFVSKKINKLLDIGRAIRELTELKDKLKGTFERRENEIDDLRKSKNNTNDEEQFEKDLKEQCKNFNRDVSEDLTDISDRVRKMYNRIAVMFRRN